MKSGANCVEKKPMILRIAGIYLVLAIAISLVSLQAGCTATVPSPPDSAANTGEAACELEIDLLGTIHLLQLDEESRLIAGADLSSADGTIILSIDKGTQLLDKDGKPLSSMSVFTEQEIPQPEDARIIGVVYSLRPQDTVVDYPLKITLSYDPEEIPEGVRENDVYIVPYDESTGWGSYSYKRVETDKHRVTTQVERFTRYAVLAPVKPTSPQPTKEAALAPDLASISLGKSLANGLPTMAEFGSSSCAPCKQMKPILEELAGEYKDKLNVVVIEVYEQMELTRQYNIMTIPTQIFFDSSGEELSRHIGFYPKEDIIAQLQTMGIE